MSYTTTFLCDHPRCDARQDDPNGHQMEPETLRGWATIYDGVTLTQHHLCPEHLQAALTQPEPPVDAEAMRDAIQWLRRKVADRRNNLSHQQYADDIGARTILAALGVDHG